MKPGFYAQLRCLTISISEGFLSTSYYILANDLLRLLHGISIDSTKLILYNFIRFKMATIQRMSLDSINNNSRNSISCKNTGFTIKQLFISDELSSTSY